MEKKLAVIVDNKEVTTGIGNTELCSSVCDVAMETCSSQSHDACRELCVAMSHKFLEILDFTQFFDHFVFTPNKENGTFGCKVTA